MTASNNQKAFYSTHHPPHPLPPHSPANPFSSLVFFYFTPPPPPTPTIPHCPAKLTLPSSVENESRWHYNRAGQIPLVLSETEHEEAGSRRQEAHALITGGGRAPPTPLIRTVYGRQRTQTLRLTSPNNNNNNKQVKHERTDARRKEETQKVPPTPPHTQLNGSSVSQQN